MPSNNLHSGHTQSCGCYSKEAIHAERHGMSDTPEYHAYTDAQQRCLNPNNPGYPYYGGRGIEFRFNSFEEFFAELGTKASPDLELDRIDNDGHYEVGNVRWTNHLAFDETLVHGMKSKHPDQPPIYLYPLLDRFPQTAGPSLPTLVS